MQTDQSKAEHATTPVPEAQTVSGWQVGLVIIGIAITLPGLYSGGEVAQVLGLKKALLALIFGAAVLAIMSIPTAIVGQQTRRTSYAMIRHVFGAYGGHALNALFALILLGWYAVTADLFGRTLQTGLLSVFDVSVPVWALTMVSSALVTLTTLYGFQAIDRLAIIAVPLLFALIAFISVRTLQTGFDPAPTQAGSHEDPFIWAVNTVIGAMVVSVVLMPDLSRYARSKTDAIVAAILGNGIGSVVAMALAMIPALATGTLDPMGYMLAAGMGVAAVLVLVSATWTTNAVNLYSTGLVVAEITRKERYASLVLAGGVIGTGFALLGAADYLIDFLILLGVVVPPVAGVYLIDYFIFGGKAAWPGLACLSAATSTALGLLLHFGLLPSGFSSKIAALDTLIVSALLYWASVRLAAREARA